MNYSELLQLAKGWGNFISDRIIIWRLQSKYKKQMPDTPALTLNNSPNHSIFKSFYFVTTICTVLLPTPKALAVCRTVALLSMI